MPIFRFGSKSVLFIHVPKTGGSSIEQSLRIMGCKCAFLYSSALGYAKCTPQHMHREIIEAFIPENFCDFTFSVVRNPWSRLLSEYKMRKDNAGLQFREWVEITFDRYQKNPYVYDNHIRPQIDFITKSTKVFKFEDGLSAPVQAVAELLGTPSPDLPRKRESGHFVPPEDSELDRLIYDFYRMDYEAFQYPLGANPVTSCG